MGKRITRRDVQLGVKPTPSPDQPPAGRVDKLLNGTQRCKMGVLWEVRDGQWVKISDVPALEAVSRAEFRAAMLDAAARGARPTLYNHADYDQAAAKVRQAHAANGFPIDENGIRRLLITLRALGLIDWKEGPPSPVRPPDFRS